MKALVFFLKHGTLPWWFKPLSHQRWENDLLLALSKPGTVPGEQNPELSRHLFIQLQKTLQTTAARERLSEQFSQEVFWAVVETLFTHNKQKGFLQLFASWTEINQTAWKDWTRASVELVLSEKKLKQLLLEACSAEDISTDYLTLFLSKILTYDANEQKTIRMEVLTASVWVKKIFPEGVTEKIKEYIYKHTEQAKEDRAVKKEELVLPETKQQQQSAKEKKMEEVEQKDGIYVNNGGAVILATYLPMFFNRCGLCEDEKQLTNSDKAIALLHYLVTGHTAYREYEVVLYKTLCGLEMEKTVQLITELTNEEKELAEGLLTAVIQNWPILKNTSVEALRETFLQREAKLMVAPDAAMLKVERKTVDILIDQLPWTISMIKLPWMKKLLKVEW